MSVSLKNFHFDPEKSGRILNGWAKEAGIGIRSLADDTGYTYDTTNNSLHGKIKDLSLERVFKFSVRTGHSVCEYIRLMLQDEDIDFADEIHVLREVDFTLVPYANDHVSGTKSPVSDAKSCTNLVQAPVFDQNSPEVQAVYRAIMEQATAVHQANLERVKGIYDNAIKEQNKAHDDHIETVRKVARQRLRWIIILAVVLLAFVAWFIWDLSHPEIGLIRLKQMGYIGQMLTGKK